MAERPKPEPVLKPEDYQGDQTRQSHQLLAEIVNRLGAVGSKLTDLDGNVQKQIAGHAADIATLREDIESVQREAAKRFVKLAEHYSGGRPYRGRFPDAQTARAAGLLVIYALTQDAAAKAELEKAGINPTVGAEGGFLMPDLLVTDLVRNVEEAGVWERNVDMMNTPVLTGGIPTRTGGLTVYYPDYETAATPSAATFGRKNFALKRHSVYVLVERWMLQSQLAVALAEFVTTEMSYALALAEDTNWFMGDGTSTYCGYHGLMKDTTIGSYTPTADYDEFSELIGATTDPLSRVLGTLPAWAAGDGCKWYMHSSVFFGYMGVKDSAGMPIVQLYMSGNGLAKVLFGYPVEWVQVMPAVGSAGDTVSSPMLVAGNLRRACLGFRHAAGIAMRSSEHVKFAEGQVAMLLEVPQDRVVKDPTGVCRLLTHS